MPIEKLGIHMRLLQSDISGIFDSGMCTIILDVSVSYSDTQLF